MVIAILAILIAIAIPVFTGMVADSQLRVNQANIRSVKAAAVAKILTNLHEIDDGGTRKYNEGTANHGGWIAVAKVDNAGTVSELQVFTLPGDGDYGGYYVDDFCSGIFYGYNGNNPTYPQGANWLTYAMKTANANNPGNYFAISTGSEKTDDDLAGISPTSGSTKTKPIDHYVVQVAIKDIEVDAKKD